MKDVILLLMQKVFLQDFPSSWEKQILHTIPKGKHTLKDPKLTRDCYSTSVMPKGLVNGSNLIKNKQASEPVKAVSYHY